LELIDFDGQFTAFLRAWLEDNSEKYQDIREVEALMPELYEQFLHTPAAWLGGGLPCDYFSAFPGPQSLVEAMAEYLDAGIPVPELLLDSIGELGMKAEGPLYDLLQDETAGNEARMLCIHLLQQIGSRLPLQLYVSWQQTRGDEDELADRALGSLEEMGEEAVPFMLDALGEAADAGREALLDVLSRFPGCPGVYEALIRLFEACPERQATLSAFLGRFGDARALPLLTARAEEEGLRYFDYIELRAAIETLGGEAPDRAFSDDPEYETLRGLM